MASLQKQTADSVQRCASMQQHWLRQQNELVRKTRQAEEEAAAVDSLKKQQLILEQKKLRIDGRGASWNYNAPFTKFVFVSEPGHML